MKNKKQNSIYSWIFVSASFLVLIIGIIFYLSRDGEQNRTITYTEIGFDTPVQFQAYCSEKDFNKYSEIVEKTFKEQDQIFNAYDETSLISKINQSEPETSIPIPAALEECIQISLKANQTYYKFDISQGQLLKVWHEIRNSENPKLPDFSHSQLESGMDAIQIQNHTISLSKPIQLDMGGIAKGYTAEVCKEKLNEAGLHNGFINAGGNVVLLGEKADGSPWTIGIQSPDDEQAIVQITADSPVCFVTSGDYQRYASIEGKKYGHIIDPDTKFPAEYVRSVTIIHEDSAWADAMSTALFCMSLEDGMEFAKKNDLKAVWVCDTSDVHEIKPDFTTEKYNIYTTQNVRNSVELSQNFTK